MTCHLVINLQTVYDAYQSAPLHCIRNVYPVMCPLVIGYATARRLLIGWTLFMEGYT